MNISAHRQVFKTLKDLILSHGEQKTDTFWMYGDLTYQEYDVQIITVYHNNEPIAIVGADWEGNPTKPESPDWDEVVAYAKHFKGEV